MTITNQIISFKLSGISYSGTSTQLNYTAGVSIGACLASKALVVDLNRNINNINTITATTLTATTLNGTLATSSQPNITSIGTLTNLNISNNLTLSQHNGSTIGLILGSTLVTATGIQLNYNDITTVGTAQALKALILDSNISVSGINNLSATTLTSTNFVLNGTSITVNGTQLNYNNITTPGTAQASRSLVLNSSSNISSINTLTATTLTATTLNGTLATASQTNITSVGILTSLVLSGAMTGATDITISGTLTSANVACTNLTGTIVTSAQPNITSLGSLSNLNVLGTITSATVSASNILIGGVDITSVLSNLGAISGVTNGTASASKALVLDASRNISNINSLTSTSLTATNITGALQTPAQPNITSLSAAGLTTLAIAGSITTVTNITMTGSLSGANSISSTSFNGRIDTASQPNITSLGSLTGLTVSGNTGMGSTTPSRQLEINSSIGSCLRLSFAAPTGSAVNFTDLTLNSSGALTINSSNNLINLQSRVVIGKSSTANILCFNGVTGDTGIDMTVIVERLYSGSDKSELLLFKGNDVAGTSGPDRIRMRAGEIRFQIYTAAEDYSTLADNNDALIISSSGKLGVNCTSPTQQLEINNSTGNCLRLIYNDNDGSPTVYSDVNVNSLGALNIKSNNNTVQIGDSSDNGQSLLVGSSSTTATTGIIRHISTSGGNYIQSGINTTAGSAADLFIGNYLQNITTSSRKITFKADGKVGFGTTAPTRQLEINDTTGSCLRLSYNASAGSATTYCDQSISSAGVVTFTAAGSGPSFAFTGGNIAATLSTASQPNITALGTLTGLALASSANITLSAGNITGVSTLTATTLTGTLSTGVQPNITTLANVTSVGTLTGLNVSGNTKLGSSTSGTDLLNISSNSASFTGLRIENRSSTANTSGSKISFIGYHTTNTDWEAARIAAVTVNSGVSATLQYGDLAFYTKGNSISTNADEKMRILSTGNVGIGYTTPSYLLDVNGTSRTKQLLVGTSTDNLQYRLISALDSTIVNGITGYITLGKAATTNNQAEMGYYHTSDGSTSNALTLGLYGGEKMRISANGNVGISTTTPTCRLDLGLTATNMGINLYGGTFGLGAVNGFLNYYGNTSHKWWNTQADVRLGVSQGTNTMTLSGTGDLTVSSTIRATNYMYVSDSGLNGRYMGNWPASNYWAIGPHDSSTGTTYRLRIGVSSATGVWNGEYPAIFSGAYTNASDYRIKENVTNLNYGLNEIKKIRPVLYNIKNDLNNKQIGFIAHEMQEIIPEVVSGDKDEVDEEGNEVHQGINYANLTSVIIKGMQEHIEITNNLEDQIKLLNIENTQIKQQMAEMQKSLELLLQKN